MSDYMFMLENHLSADQNRVVAEVQAAAGQASLNLFLAGGAVRDMLGGFQVRDLDFSVEGNALKLAKALSDRFGAQIVSTDENRRQAELVFPGGVTAQVALSRTEHYPRMGARPRVTPATIQEDLRGRDFSVNAIALSLNRASRGLLLDPTNGLADLQRHELRMLSTYTFYDDPARLLRLVRLRVRLGFTVDERTRLHYDNARSARVQQHVPRRTLFEELRQIAAESSPAEIVRALEADGLLGVFSEALSGAKLNLPGLVKLERAMRLLPAANGALEARFGPFLYVLTERLSPREKAALIKNLEMRKSEVDLFRNVEPRARKLESALKSARVRKPSQVYHILSQAALDEVLLTLYRSPHKPVQERIRNYLQKYLPLVQEMPPEELAAIAAKPGTPRYEKAREALVAQRLDHRPRRPAPVAAQPVPIESGLRTSRAR
jgi:tRNA nucleotidyltransferase/poly(A) polymerase